MHILDRFVTDHERLRSLLTLFEQELAAYDADAGGDLQLMQDIANYYAEYFNRYHHPLEDHLFELLLQRDPGQRDDAVRGMTEHEQLLRSSDRLLSVLDQVLHGSILPREKLLGTGRRFLRQNLEHMQREEQDAFARAARCLTATDWRAVTAEAAYLAERVDVERGRRQYDDIIDNLYSSAAGE